MPLSALLLTLAERDPAPVTVGDVVRHFGPRSFGPVIFVLAVPNLLPLPPGSSTFLSLPLLLIAPQLALGQKHLWLPAALERHPLDPREVAAACRRIAPWVARAEHLTTRRLGFMFGGPGDLLIGVVCTLLAAVLALPIPLGNLAPAAAVAALALSLTQRDGLLAIGGYLLAMVSGGLLVVSSHLVLSSVTWLGSATGLW